MEWFCYKWNSLCFVNGGLNPWISPWDLWGSRLRIKTTRRKVARTKQFIKVKVHSEGGKMGRFLRWNQPLDCYGISIGSLWVGRRYEVWGGVVCNGDCFLSCGNRLAQVGRGSVWPYKVCIGLLWQPITVVGCTHNANALFESRGYSGAEVEEESACPTPMVLGLSAPRSWKP